MDRATELRAKREMVGHSQQSLAAALGVHVRTVSRWERGAVPVPDDALDFVDEALERQNELVHAALGIVEGAPNVSINYARSQEDFDAGHPGDGRYYGEANAAARQVAANLYAMGIPFEFKHAEPGTLGEYERIEL